MNAATTWSSRGAHYRASAPHKSGPSLPKLLALARPTPQDVCLDLGTGAGHTAALLAQYSHKVVGLDPAEGMLREARETYGHLAGLEFVLGTGAATGFAEGTFDLVTARHTLHHHPDVGATLREVARVMKPGGRLVIVDEVTPDARIDAWYNTLERARDRTHERAYLLPEWQGFIAEAGLLWVVGDAHSVYTLEVADWTARMDLTPEEAETVQDLFRCADAHARRTLNIVYEDGRAVRFDMPMALILAVKPGGKDDL